MERFSLGWVICGVYLLLGMQAAVVAAASFRPQVSWILVAAGAEGDTLAAVVVQSHPLVVYITRSETLVVAAPRSARHFIMGMS